MLRLHPEAQVEQGLFQQLAAFHIFQRLDAGGGQADEGLVVIQRLPAVAQDIVKTSQDELESVVSDRLQIQQLVDD